MDLASEEYQVRERVQIVYCSKFDWLSFFLLVVFILLGTPGESFRPSADLPALQCIATVDEHGTADQSGLQVGDFLIEVSLLLDPVLHIHMKISYQACSLCQIHLVQQFAMVEAFSNNKTKKHLRA